MWKHHSGTLKRQQFPTGFLSPFSRACSTWSVQITSEYNVFWWSFQDIHLFCFLVWWWSGLVRDRKCLDYFGRQLAEKSENNFALLDQYLWSEQWTQPFALCEYVTGLSLVLIDILKISSMSSSKDHQTKMWGKIYSVKISTLYLMTIKYYEQIKLGSFVCITLDICVKITESIFQSIKSINLSFMEWTWEGKSVRKNISP